MTLANHRGPGWWSALRPDQWIKNLLVVAAPVAAGVIFNLQTSVMTALAFLAFCSAASAGYLFNDVIDRSADQLHPVKQHRAIASGRLSVGRASLLAAVLAITSLVVGAVVNTDLLAIICTYLALQVLYCLWLKNISIVELATVSTGFVLRFAAGGAAAEVPLSVWFFLTAVFGSLLMVSGKRSAEMHLHGPSGGTRRSLASYSPDFLRFMWQMSATSVILVYGTWAVGGGQHQDNVWLAITLAPFAMAVLRYCQHVDAGDAEAPERLALQDRLLQFLALAWLVSLLLCLYLAV